MDNRTWVGFESLEDVKVPLEWKSGSCGSVIEFRGCVRNVNDGLAVVGIKYEAHLSLAANSLEEIRAKMLKEFSDISDICIYHRIGKLELGETSLIVGVASAHRKNAFHVSQKIIDEIKKKTPVWKCELYAHEKEKWLAGTSLRRGASDT